MATQEVPIEKLETGMFVTGLDVSWLKTPFIKHSMLIEKEAQIFSLKSCGVKIVTIDTEKGIQPQQDSLTEKNETPLPTKPKSTSLHKEFETAKQIKASTKKAMQNLYAFIKRGESPKKEMVLPFVEQIMESLSRNSNAIINLFLMKSEPSKLHNHAFNVMGLTLLVAEQLGYSAEDQRQMGLAALLMDIGWLKLHQQLFVFNGVYTDDEFSLIKQHVDYSLQYIEKGNFDPTVHQIIAQHHERYDGNGYPVRLKGDQIHVMSQIVSLIDHFDSLVNGYYDRSPVIPARALQEIYKKSLLSGHEPSLAGLLVRVVGVFPPSSAVLLNTGERGVVTCVNWRAPLAPRVKIFYNKTLSPLVRPFEVDLGKQENESTYREIKSLIDPTLRGQDPANLLIRGGVDL